MVELPFALMSFKPSPLVMWAAFVLLAAVFAAVTWALFYHWNAYLVDRKTAISAESLYLIVSMGLIAASFVSLLAY